MSKSSDRGGSVGGSSAEPRAREIVGRGRLGSQEGLFVRIHKQHMVIKGRTVPWIERRFQTIIKSAKGRVFLGRRNGCRTAS